MDREAAGTDSNFLPPIQKESPSIGLAHQASDSPLRNIQQQRANAVAGASNAFSNRISSINNDSPHEINMMDESTIDNTVSSVSALQKPNHLSN